MLMMMSFREVIPARPGPADAHDALAAFWMLMMLLLWVVRQPEPANAHDAPGPGCWSGSLGPADTHDAPRRLGSCQTLQGKAITPKGRSGFWNSSLCSSHESVPRV